MTLKTPGQATPAAPSDAPSDTPSTDRLAAFKGPDRTESPTTIVDDVANPPSEAGFDVNGTIPAPKAEEPALPAPMPNPRDAIAASFKAQRAERQGEEIPLEALTPETINTPPWLLNQPQEEEKPAAPAADGWQLKVRGKEITVKDRADLLAMAELEEDEAKDLPESAIVKLAQKNAAALSYLEEARDTAKESRLSRRPGDTPSPGEEDTPLDPNDPSATGQDDGQPQPEKSVSERRKEIVRKIQYGDEEEAAAALEELDALNQEVHRQQQAFASIDSQIGDAVSAFEATAQDFLTDEDLSDLFYNRTVVAEVKKDLVASGKVTQQAADNLIRNVNDAMKAYSAAALHPDFKVRPPAQILADAAAGFRSKFGLAAPQPQQQPTQQPAPVSDRQALKRQLAPQPTRATATPSMVRSSVPPSGNRTGTSVVEQMRKARGQST